MQHAKRHSQIGEELKCTLKKLLALSYMSLEEGHTYAHLKVMNQGRCNTYLYVYVLPNQKVYQVNIGDITIVIKPSANVERPRAVICRHVHNARKRSFIGK
ncbi:hypothetical protein XU18_0452 [Perkinsela sp. CCAP 1560/4]|nr:hypothetical protein XU18_0452 [Perkinsela sp. CCAP 1560/4]|eukprot:KNH09767.1 hypothetical protein XU18_0452 [Perkinsela sp. CCAP 1560/4]